MAVFTESRTKNTFDPASVYERYVALNQLAAERLDGRMGGRLMLYGNVDEYGGGCALAANIAGATALGIGPDKEVLKQAIRNGICDFMVNSLDEALRILKNEIRKKQPVSVCLEKPFHEAMKEIAARGVQPDILALTPLEEEGSAVETALLLERGAGRLPVAQAESVGGREGVHWSVANFPALWLPKVDAVAASVLGDELRCRWLSLAPAFLGRRAHAMRYVEMAPEESRRFVRDLRVMIDEGNLKTEITVQCGGRQERLVPSS